MKKLVLAVMAFSLAAPAAWALEPMNPTAMVEKGRVAVGYAGTYVFQQKLKEYDLKRSSTLEGQSTGKKQAKFEEDQFYLTTVTVGLADWLNVYGRAGVATGGKWKDHDVASGADWQADLGDTLAWALGAKARLWQFASGPALGLAVEYLRYDNRPVKKWRDTTASYSADEDWSTNDHLDYWQLDVTALAWWPLGRFTPFLGLGWSHAELSFDGLWSIKGAPSGSLSYNSDMKLEDNLSAMLGLAANLTEGLSLTVSGTLVSQTAVSLGLAYNF